MGTTDCLAVDLLRQARRSFEEHENRARREGRDFNLFDVLDRAEDEVKGHSAFLAALLRPGGAHGQGRAFLELFLTSLGADAAGLPTAKQPLLADVLLADHCGVRTEVPFEFLHGGKCVRGRVDLLLEAAAVDMIIENKIYAGDQEAQLDRYAQFAKRRGKRALIFYLTLDGAEPSSQSYGSLSREDVVCISYCDLIDQWLTRCAAAACGAPGVLAAIQQYQALIRRLSGVPMESAMTTELAALLNDQQNLAAAVAIEQALREAKVRIQSRFWVAMQAALQRRLAIADRSLVPCEPSIAERVASYYSCDSGSNNFGIVIRLAQPDAARSLSLFVFVDKHIYYGLKPFLGSRGVDWPTEDPWGDIRTCAVQAMPDCKSNAWGLYKLPRVRLNFRAFAPTCLPLSDPSALERQTDEIAAEIQEAIERLRERLSEMLPAIPLAIGCARSA